MAGELLQKIKKLKNIIIKKNNEEFGRKAVEILNASKVDEGILDVGGEEHTEGSHAEKYMEAEYLCVEKELRKSISEEEEAVANYLARAKKALLNDDRSLYELYKELAGDELVHVAQLRTALDLLGMTDKVKEIKGRLEAQVVMGAQITEEKEDEHTRTMRKLRKKADKTRKEFDFVAEYTKGKLEHARKMVVGAINDLIIGKDDLEGTVDRIMKDGKKIVKSKKSDKKDDEEIKKD